MIVHFISLGCPRNLVDTEQMLGRILKTGHTLTSDPSEANCVVVNTCSFVRPAVEESIDVILEMAEWKKEAKGRRLVVAGCLPERYRLDLVSSLPEVDTFLGTGAFHRIVDAVQGALGDERMLLPPPGRLSNFEKPSVRLRTGMPHVAYLKIAEGCSGRCTYCIIPKLRGSQASRPLEDLLSEARSLVETGVKELILVAQNTTAYGHDLKLKFELQDVLGGLADIAGLKWIRCLYGHPSYVTDQFLAAVAAQEKVCSYFDLPVQHISKSVLKRMGREGDSTAIFRLFDRIRNKVPDAVLRTTLMVGFPGETEENFKALVDFVETVRFDHMGAFMYSDESDLPAHRLKGHVPEEVKLERFEQLMARQSVISEEHNQDYVGRILKVLVDGTAEDGTSALIGRTEFQAPGIDGVVRIRGDAKPGSFVDVRITDAHPYDLTGELI